MASVPAPRFVQLIDRGRWWLFAAFGAALATILCVHAEAKPFWHDEIYTILESRLPLGTLWRACRDGIDLAPPLAPVLTKLASGMFGEGRIATRLPEMAALGIACALLFVMIRRRSNVLVALAGVILVCFTPALDFAIEARGYALTIAAFAAALYGWSEAAQRRAPIRNLAIMAAALAAGVWAHYYAALVFLPIATGEAFRQARRRSFDRAPWLAMAAAVAAITPLVPLVLANAAQAEHFWTRVNPLPVKVAYQFMSANLLAGRTLLAAYLLGLLALVEAFRRMRGRRSSRRLDAHEVAAGLTALLLPAAGVLLGTLAGGLVTVRYITFAVVGFALVIPLAAWRLTPDNAIGDVVLCLALLTSFIKSTGRALPGRAAPFRDPVADSRPVLASALATGDPVVVTGAVDYLQLWFYAPAGRGGDADLSLANPRAELAATGTDSVDWGYLALSRWTPVAATDAAAFLASHRTFRLYTFGSEWLTPALRSAGASFEETGHDADGKLYVVRLPG